MELFWQFIKEVFDTWAEKVGIILTILPFIEKIPRVRTWLQEKPILDRFVPLLWVVGIACMVGGFYSAWDDQHRAAMRANQQLESLSKPELTGLINQVVIGDDPGEVGCQFFFDIAVKNSGAPSIAYDWELSMDQPPLNRIGAAYIQEGYTMKKNNKPYAIFHSNMRAEERVMKIPIQ